MEDLGTHAHGLDLGLGAHGTNHKLLESNGCVAVRTTVDDIHHGHGQHMSVGAADVAIQGHTEVVSGSVSHSERNAQDGVSAELALGGSAVELDHGHVDGTLVKGIHTLDFRGDYLVDILDSLQHTLATVTFLVTVTQLQGLVLTSGCTTGHRCTAHVTALEGYFNFYCRVTTRIQNLSGMNLFNIHNLTYLELIIVDIVLRCKNTDF